MSTKRIEEEYYKRGDRIIQLETSLRRLIERGRNGELGTSKVIDMLRIAEQALNQIPE